MRNPTKAQRALMQQLDNGHEIEAIASNLGKSVLAVRRQGHHTPRGCGRYLRWER